MALILTGVGKTEQDVRFGDLAQLEFEGVVGAVTLWEHGVDKVGRDRAPTQSVPRSSCIDVSVTHGREKQLAYSISNALL